MQLSRVLKRRPYLLYLVAFAVGSPFGLSALGHVRQARAVAMPAAARAEPVAALASPPRARDKSGAALAARNMFCSTCEGPPPPEGNGSRHSPRTPLPLELIATHVAARDDRSFATIRQRDPRRVAAYGVGDAIPSVGVIEAVRGRYVLVRRDGADTAERLELLGATEPTVAPRSHEPATGSPAGDDEGIARLGDDHYEIDRGVIEQALANPTAIGARVRLGGGGVQLFAVRPSSPLAQIGLRNGDVIKAANGMSLSNADAMLEVYGRLRQSSSIELTIERAGQERSIRYAIR